MKFHSINSAAGVKHTTMLASVVVDAKEGKDVPRIVVTGNTNNTHHFNLTVPLPPETPVDLALAEAAFRTMSVINPYRVALYAFEKAEVNGVRPVEANRIIEEWIEKAPTSVYSPERALFENLGGLSFLIDNNVAMAETWFSKAQKSDPDFAPAKLNLAFIAL